MGGWSEVSPRLKDVLQAADFLIRKYKSQFPEL